MKTTIEVPDELYCQAKTEAAFRGREFGDLIEEGLRLILRSPGDSRKVHGLAGLMKEALGVVESGIPDLASNPEHLAGLGRDARDR